MATNEFGKVAYIAREYFIKGYMLREMNTGTGVVLEYHEPEDMGVDVVARFDGARINNEEDLRKCLTEARKYVEDMEVTIYVDLNARRK